MFKIFAPIVLTLALAGCGGLNYIPRADLAANYKQLDGDNAEFQEFAASAGLVRHLNQEFLGLILGYAFGVGGDPEVPMEHKDAIVRGAEHTDHVVYLLNKADVELAEGRLANAVVLLDEAKKSLLAAIESTDEARKWLDTYWAKKNSI